MNIQINTDNHIQGSAALIKKFSGAIESGLSQLSNHITLVQAHLSDENGAKNGKNDKRCTIEARLEGRQRNQGSARSKGSTTDLELPEEK